MRALGWVVFVATCVLVVLQGVMLGVADTPLLSYDVLVDQAFPLLGIGAVVGAGVGALIVSRYPRSVIGWLFLVSQLGQAIGLAAGAFAALVADGTIDAPQAGQVAQYFNQVFEATYTIVVLSVIFMIVPDGRLLSSRWRAAVAIAILSFGFRIIAVVCESPDAFVPSEIVRWTGVSLLLILASFITALVAVALGGVALVLRLRRSTGQQHLQLRWISTAGAALAGTFLVFAIVQLFFDGPAVWLLTELTLLAYIFLPVAVGVAILRYRLYDIDVILSRAIVLGTLAVFVTVGYIAVVVAIGWVLAAVTTSGSTPYWPSLVASALVAAAFQPLRRHVLRLADQLVYGSRAAPYEALATLSRRLADSPSPDALPGRVAQAAGRAVGAARTVVFLGTPDDGAPVLVAGWPEGGWPENGGATAETPTFRLPVLDRDEQVGSLEVCMPPGRALRTFERRLLQDVAAQAGVAFRNALLEAELAARVAEGQARSAELMDSRRRLVGVEDEARERLAAAIRRSVVPHLAAVGTGLAGADRTLKPDRLEPLIAETELALEELRSVCRGVFPALLERRGLVPALISQLGQTHPRARLDVAGSADGRLDRAVEAAGYQFCVDVAPTDRPCVIALRVDDDRLIVTVTWADTDRPSGSRADLPNSTQSARVSWQHAEDRVAALDGRVLVERTDDGSVAVRAEIPSPRETTGARQAASEIAAQTVSSRSGPNADFGT